MRKGSKRFPNKVRQKLLGKELWEWTAETALRLGYPYFLAHDYDDLIVPNMINEIKREPKYAEDKHQTCEEIKSFGLNADVYIFLQATNPLRDIEDVRLWIKDFIKNIDKFDCGFSAYPLPKKYFYSGINYKELNFDMRQRTDNGCEKDLICMETGNFYIFKKEQLEYPYILYSPPERRIIYIDNYFCDIDKEKDLKKLNKRMRVKL
jgi:CMP-N-acetylneuraminic acid synthetase